MVSRIQAVTPTRDGTRLATDVHLPAGAGPWPVLCVRTPYDRRAAAAEGEAWARRGVAFAAQDVRGRYGSGGQWQPYLHEHADGADTLDWIARQPWALPALALKGASYQAYTALAAAESGHPALRTVISTVPVPGHAGIAFSDSGVLHLSGRAWWNAVHGGARASDPNREGELLADLRRRLSSLPVSGLAPRLGIPDELWRADLRPDERRREVRPDRITVPVLHVGGWFDAFVRHSVRLFNRCGGPPGTGRAPQWLVIGPWGHTLDAGERGGVWRIPAPARRPSPDVESGWLARWLPAPRLAMSRSSPGGMPGPPGDDRVRYYVLGANRWYAAAGWPPRTRALTLHLGRRRGAGTLSTGRPDRQSPDRYRYDPRSPAPDLLGPVDIGALCARPDVLSFFGAALSRPVTLVGQARAELYVASDAPDTDFVVRLVDVFPDGRVVHVAHGLASLRAHGADRAPAHRLSVPLTPVAVAFAAGHRIGALVTSSCFPYYARSLNTGDCRVNGTRTRVAEQVLCHDRARPSRIVLPALAAPVEGTERADRAGGDDVHVHPGT